MPKITEISLTITPIEHGGFATLCLSARSDGVHLQTETVVVPDDHFRSRFEQCVALLADRMGRRIRQ